MSKFNKRLIQSWVEYDNSAINSAQFAKEKYTKHHRKSFSDLKLAHFTPLVDVSR